MSTVTARGYPIPQGPDLDDVPATMQAAMAAVDVDITATVPGLALTTVGDFYSMMLVTSTGGLASSNQAIGVLIRPQVTITPTKFVWDCTTQSGNYDVAIVNATTRARIWSKGSTACPAPGEIVETVTGATLTAGTWYALAWSANNTTAQIRMATMSRTSYGTTYNGTVGVWVVNSSFPFASTVPAWSAGVKVPVLSLRA